MQIAPGDRQGFNPGGGLKSGRTMNPYEASLPNIAARLRAWVRGIMRLYRRPLLAATGVGMLVALGAGGAFPPATSQTTQATATPR